MRPLQRLDAGARFQPPKGAAPAAFTSLRRKAFAPGQPWTRQERHAPVGLLAHGSTRSDRLPGLRPVAAPPCRRRMALTLAAYSCRDSRGIAPRSRYRLALPRYAFASASAISLLVPGSLDGELCLRGRYTIRLPRLRLGVSTENRPPDGFLRSCTPSLALGSFNGKPSPGRFSPVETGGAEGNRTPDLVIANDALSQLSYGPVQVCASAICHAPASAGH